MKQAHPKYPPAPRRLLEVNYSYENGNFDPFTLVMDNGDYAIRAARGVRRDLARSYRGFLVGSTALALNEGTQHAAMYAAANWKPAQHVDKKCAEMGTIGGAKAEKYADFTPGLFVTAVTDRKKIKEITGLETPTLHPCSPCRTLLDMATVVISFGADPEEEVFEAYTGRELWEKYQTPNPFKKKITPGALERSFGKPDFDLAKEIYNSDALDILKEAPEAQTRMLRAELVVEAVRLSAES